MPYSVPAIGRPGHRRSYSHIVAPSSMSMATVTTTTATPGPFESLGVLPTRRRPSGRATFQLGSREDDDDDSPDESPEDNTHNDDDDDDGRGHLPPLRLKTKFLSSFDAHPIPFPRSSPLPSPTHKEEPLSPLTMGTAATTLRPSVSRTSSTPILLSNGKPLKSSLKSSNSSPNIPFPPQSLVPSIMYPQHHQRAASAPTTPHLPASSASAPTSPCSSPSSSSTATSPVVPPQKNVHFASQEEGGLATVRVYKRSAKPASLLRIGDETETETEGESSSAPTGFFASIWNTGRAPTYPFPRLPTAGASAASPVPKLAASTEAHEELIFEIDMKNSTPVPARGAERAEGNVYFESLGFLTDAGSDKPTQPLCLMGTLLVRNISYHKVVTVRYTLDDWHTTNDVLARYEKSLAAIPERFLLASLPMIEEGSSTGGKEKREVVCRPRGFEDVVLEDGGVPAWDRFRFELSLEKYQSSIEQRTMWFVGRYATGGASAPSNGDLQQEQEWWDNNLGANYRVGFAKRVVKDRLKDEERKRKEGIYGGVNVNLSTYKRNVSHSAPPQFSPSRPHPAPPQISASQSFPPDSLTSRTTQIHREQHAQAHQAALEQRLRRLNLRNYAAPGLVVPGVGIRSPLGLTDSQAEDETGHEEGKEDDRPSLTLPLESSTTTSADSTPLQTPTQDAEDLRDLAKGTGSAHDADVNILMHDDDDGEWSLRRKVPEPSEDVAETVQMGKGRGVPFEERSAKTPTPSHPTTDMVGLGFGVEMGTSPPFSLLAGLDGRLGSLAGMGSAVAMPMAGMGRRQSSSQIHQNSAPGQTPVQSLSSSVSNPLTPPQRRRHSHGHAQPVPAFSIGRTSSSTSSPPGTRSGSGSGSGSGSDSTSTTTARARSSGMKLEQPQWKIQSPQPWPLAPQRRVTTVPPQISSPLATTILTEDEETLERSPSPSLALRQLLPRGSSLLQEALPSQSLPTEQPPLSPPDNALYQAFVRQWCFASAPGPTVSGPVGNGNVNGNGKGTEGGVAVR